MNDRVKIFLETHPDVDIDALMIMAIDMYEYVSSSQSSVSPSDMRRYMRDMDTKLDKLLNIKSSYISDMRGLLYEKNEKLIDEIRSSNYLLLNATRESLSEIIPRLNDIDRREMDIMMSRLENNLTNETSKLLKSLLNDSGLTELINQKYMDIMNNLSTSEDRMSSKLLELRDVTGGYNNIAINLSNNVSQLLDKFNNSCQKGKLSETLLSNILSRIYSSGEIIDMSDMDHSCDIRLVRLGKSDILFENKNYSTNVKGDEVKKFQEDIMKHEQNGIMLSQGSGITNKKDYEIEILNNRVLLYLHNVNYDIDKIRLGVDIVDSISETLSRLDNKESTVNITEEMVREINIEYINFIKMRDNLVTFLRDSSNEAIIKLKNLQFPRIEYLFVNRRSDVKEKSYTCQTCKSYKCLTRKELNLHKLSCLK